MKRTDFVRHSISHRDLMQISPGVRGVLLLLALVNHRLLVMVRPRYDVSYKGRLRSCLALLVFLLTHLSSVIYAAPFPFQFEPRLMSVNEGRLLGGSEQFEHFGERVTGLGDVNGDGFADFAISGYSQKPGSYDSFSVLVYGSSADSSLEFDLRSVEEEGAVYLEGAMIVYPAGDVNADGFDDWVFRSGSGEYALVSGQAEPYTSPLSILSNTSVSSVRIINSEINADFPEWKINRAGDITGDGIDDLVIDEGLYLWTVPGQPGILAQKLDLANYPRHRLPNAYHDISSGYDINGDGFNDVLVGMDEAEGYRGQVIVLFGSSGLFPSTLTRETLNGQNGFVIESTSAMHGFRLGSEALLSQDVNGDGISDILLSAFDSVYILYGQEQSWPAFLDLDQLASESGLMVEVTEATPNNLAAIGDINNDGLGDWAVELIGEIQIVYGVAEAGSILILDSISNDRGFLLQNTIATDDYKSVSNRIGDVNGDGIDDMLFADEYGYTLFEYSPGITLEEIDNRAARNGMTYLVFGRADEGSPGSPSDLRVAIGPGLIELRWTSSSSEVGEYEIRRNGDVIARVDGEINFFVDDNVTIGEAYRYEVLVATGGSLSSPLGIDVVNNLMRYPSIGGSVYSQTLAEIFWAYENVEYTIYRDDVAVATRWASSYLDGNYMSAGYSYHVAVVTDDDSPITVRSRELHLPEEGDSRPPSRPENLEYRVYSGSTLELFWGRSDSEHGPLKYTILSDGELIGQTQGNSILDSTLTADDYFRNYEVFALDDYGNQSAPARISINIDEAQKARRPAEAVDYATHFPDANSVRLSWELDVLGTLPSGFEIWRDGYRVGITEKAIYTDNTLAENRRYKFEVISFNNAGVRSEPTSVLVQTPGGPFAPDTVSTAVYGPNLVEVFWSRAEGATRVWSYDLYRNDEFLLNTRSLSYLDSQVIPGKTYSYSVLSVATDRRSGPTEPVDAVVPAEQYWSDL